MRRIAFLAAGVALAVSGCATGPRLALGPLPEPILVTRPPPVRRPIVRRKSPPRMEPRPIPTPVVRRRTADPGWYPAIGMTRDWKTIVVHHSASAKDSPASMDNHHRNVRGWANGLGYHFVIGNGVNYPDGKVYVGSRWKKQISGAHCATRSGTYFGTRRSAGFFNDFGIGICLIGNFNQTRPTPKQLASLRRLVSFLTTRASVPYSKVYGHGHITRRTDCPGRNVTLSSLRRTLGSVAATSN